MSLTHLEDEYINEPDVDYDKVTPKGIEDIRAIVTGHSATMFTWGKDDNLLVDMQTANMLCVIHDALSEKSRVGFISMIAKSRGHFLKVVDFGWSSVK